MTDLMILNLLGRSNGGIPDLLSIVNVVRCYYQGVEEKDKNSIHKKHKKSNNIYRKPVGQNYHFEKKISQIT